MINLIIFGAPGAGKGTQSAKIVAKYQLMYLGTGEILRTEIAAKSELGIQAKALIDKGMLVPDSMVIDMIKFRIENNKHAKGFIFDGFPRTTKQAEVLDELLKEINSPVTSMVALEVDNEEVIKRILLRGNTSGRPEDKGIHAIKNRLSIYESETSLVLDYYKTQGKVQSVYGKGAIEDIFGNICQIIDSFTKV